jgi:hypothetical protein
MKPRIKPRNPLLFVFEPLEDDPHFFLHKLFSFDAAHLGNRIYLAVSSGEEPWNGLLVCTAREHHASLRRQFPQLVSHEVLGKWLYISQSHGEFESVALDLAALARKRDPRLGVVSKAKIPRDSESIIAVRRS